MLELYVHHVKPWIASQLIEKMIRFIVLSVIIKKIAQKKKIPNKQTSMLLILKITKKLNASNIIDKKIL